MMDYRYFFQQIDQAIAYFSNITPVDLSLSVEEKITQLGNFICIECNKAYAASYGVPLEKMPGLSVAQFVVDNAQNRLVIEQFFLHDCKVNNVIIEQTDANKKPKWFRLDTIPIIKDNHLMGYWVQRINVTEMISVENKLYDSRLLYHEVFENIFDELFVVEVESNQRFRFIALNPAAERTLNTSIEVARKYYIDEWLPAEMVEVMKQRFNQCIKSEHGITFTGEVPFLNSTRHTHATMVYINKNHGSLPRIIGIARDVSEQVRSEQALKRFTWALDAVRRSSIALIHAPSTESLFQSCCDAITQDDKYSLAIVTRQMDGYEQGALEIIAVSGKVSDFLYERKQSWKHFKLGKSPLVMAVQTQHTQVANLSVDTVMPLLKELVVTHKIDSVAVIPLLNEQYFIGSLNIYGAGPDIFGEAEVKVFEELANNLVFGIKTRQINAAYQESVLQQQQQAIKLQEALENVISALANALTYRDPYTAGHQQRTAAIAVAIAKELNFTPERIHWLWLAASIHDIGKIKIPSEILTYPGKLSAIEFELIKTHPEVGYEILKNVKFPTAVAEIVRQHHEYLDGSGYPHQLKEDQILLESRIITVADIVEAMSSHRPYRPALGIDAALAEITRMRGKKLDPQVVNACLRLFQVKKFNIPELNSK